jgi:hypothetical protein
MCRGVSVEGSGIAFACEGQAAYLEEQLVEGALADARGARDNDGTGIADCAAGVSLRGCRVKKKTE